MFKGVSSLSLSLQNKVHFAQMTLFRHHQVMQDTVLSWKYPLPSLPSIRKTLDTVQTVADGDTKHLICSSFAPGFLMLVAERVLWAKSTNLQDE